MLSIFHFFFAVFIPAVSDEAEIFIVESVCVHEGRGSRNWNENLVQKLRPREDTDAVSLRGVHPSYLNALIPYLVVSEFQLFSTRIVCGLKRGQREEKTRRQLSFVDNFSPSVLRMNGESL